MPASGSSFSHPLRLRPDWLHDIGKARFHSAEIEHAADQENQRAENGNNQHRTGRRAAEKAPAETLDDAGHRVQADQQPFPSRFENAGGPEDGSDENPDL